MPLLNVEVDIMTPFNECQVNHVIEQIVHIALTDGLEQSRYETTSTDHGNLEGAAKRCYCRGLLAVQRMQSVQCQLGTGLVLLPVDLGADLYWNRRSGCQNDSTGRLKGDRQVAARRKRRSDLCPPAACRYHR